MTAPVPENLPELQRAHAELETARFIVNRQFRNHERMAKRDGFEMCFCSDCGAWRPFIKVPDAEPTRFCSAIDEQEAVS